MAPPKKDTSIASMNGPWAVLLKLFLATFMPCVLVLLGAVWWVVSSVGGLTTRVEVAQTEREFIKANLQELKNMQKELSDDIEDIKESVDRR